MKELFLGIIIALQVVGFAVPTGAETCAIDRSYNIWTGEYTYTYEYCATGCCGTYGSEYCCVSYNYTWVYGVCSAGAAIFVIVAVVVCICQHNKKPRRVGVINHQPYGAGVHVIQVPTAGMSYPPPYGQHPAYPPQPVMPAPVAAATGLPPPVYAQQVPPTDTGQ